MVSFINLFISSVTRDDVAKMQLDFWIECYIERGTSTTHSFCSVISSTIAQKTWFYFTTKQCKIQHSHFINPNPISYHSPLSAPKILPSITMAMTSLSATSLSFQPSLNFSTPITQVPNLSNFIQLFLYLLEFTL